MKRLLEIGPFDVSEGRQRLERGDLCYTVCLDGRLAHYSWVQRKGSHPITEAGLSMTVEDGAFWIYNCRTAEWGRGKRIYPSVLARILDEHVREGFRDAWIYTSEENVSSQRGIQRAGFGPPETLAALRFGRRYYRIGKSAQGQ